MQPSALDGESLAGRVYGAETTASRGWAKRSNARHNTSGHLGGILVLPRPVDGPAR